MTSDEYEIITRPDGAQLKVRKEPEGHAEAGDSELHSCGYVEDSFACKIRHQSLQTGAANMARQWREDRAKQDQIRKYGI